MKIQASIIFYQNVDDLESCIDSLRMSSNLDGLIVDILVIANSPLNKKGRVFGDIKIIQNEHNIGFGLAANIALKHGLENNYDFVLLVNQDVCFYQNTMAEMLKAIRGNSSNVGIFSPIQLSGDGELDKKSVKSLRPEHCSIIKTIVFDEKLESYYVSPFVNASCWIIDRKVVERIGGFDPIYKHYGEDYNYVYRMKKAGYEIALVPRSHVLHKRTFYKEGVERKISIYLKKNSIRSTAIDYLRYANNKKDGFRTSILYVLQSMLTASLSVKEGVKFLAELYVIYKKHNDNIYVEL